MLVFAFALGCQSSQLAEDNARLQGRVEDLTRANARLEQDNSALKARMERLESDAKAGSQRAMLASLGVSDGQRLAARFVTSKGDITCTLRVDQAPETVANFVGLARGTREWTDPSTRQKVTRPLYNGTIFHRVIPGFMIQGGDPLGNGTGGPGYEFADEVGPFTVFDKPGLLAMANAGPNTNGSQFFITDGTPAHLNQKHTIFGDCGNLEVVSAIATAPRDGRDKPLEAVVLQTVVFTAM